MITNRRRAASRWVISTWPSLASARRRAATSQTVPNGRVAEAFGKPDLPQCRVTLCDADAQPKIPASNCVRRDRIWIVGIDTCVPMPGGFEAGQHPRYLKHHGPDDWRPHRARPPGTLLGSESSSTLKSTSSNTRSVARAGDAYMTVRAPSRGPSRYSPRGIHLGIGFVA